MVIPFYEAIVNENKYGKYDMYSRDKFIGLLTPESKIFQCSCKGHGFGPGLVSLRTFFEYNLSQPRETCLDELRSSRDLWQEMDFADKTFMISLLDWEIEYAEKYFDLNSKFMEDFRKIGWSNGGYYNNCDFLVQLLNFDKVERLPKTITTSKININEAFFNYMLMDFTIVQIPKVGFDDSVGDFNYMCSNEYVQFGLEREYEEKIQLIKKYVPLNERFNYFE